MRLPSRKARMARTATPVVFPLRRPARMTLRLAEESMNWRCRSCGRLSVTVRLRAVILIRHLDIDFSGMLHYFGRHSPMASQEVECLLRVVEFEAESRVFVLLAFFGVADSRDSLDALDEMAPFLDDLRIE